MRSARFIALVVATAVVQCGRGLPSAVPLGGADPGEPDSGLGVAAPRDGAASPDTDAGPADGGAEGDGNEAPTGASPDAAPDSAMDAATPESTGSNVSSKCDDGVGNPKDCSLVRDRGCPAAERARATCRALAAAFKPGVAVELVDCLIDKSNGPEICEMDAPKACSLAASKRACAEPSARTTCEAFLRRCPPETDFAELQAPETCAAVLSAFRRPVGLEIERCVQSECSFSKCLERVVATAAD